MSSEQQMKGDSLRRQLEATQRYAADNELHLDDSLRDIGVSAWKGLNRRKGALSRFLEMVQDGSIPAGSHLLIESLDRLSRDQVMQALKLFIDLLDSGIIIHTLADRQVYSSESVSAGPSQLIISLSIMSRAHEESERKSERVRAAFANKRKRSQLGQRTNSACPTWITATRQPDGTYLYALNERADIVRDIFERAANGMGVDRIARDLNAASVPTLRNAARGWWPTSVCSVLRSRSAIGEYQPTVDENGKRVPFGDPLANYYPAAVTADVFVRAQKIAHPNRKGGRAGTRFSNLFRDLCRCIHCHGPMYLRNNSRAVTSQQYLVCANSMRDLSCDGKANFRYYQVENAILDHVTEFGVSDLMRMQRMDQQIMQLNEQLAAVQLQVEDLTRKESRLFALYENGEDEALPGLLELLRSRSQERKDAQELAGELTKQRDTVMAKQTAMDPVSAIQAMREEWNATEDEDRRFSLRTRCNLAMREFIDQIDFDTKAGTYTVVLLGGVRAYRFTNVPFARKVMHTMHMVDMVPQVRAGSHSMEPFTDLPHSDAAARKIALQRIKQ